MIAALIVSIIEGVVIDALILLPEDSIETDVTKVAVVDTIEEVTIQEDTAVEEVEVDLKSC